jgi:putative acetyltransferase
MYETNMRGVEISDLTLRQAGPADVEGMASSHRDSILTVGPAYYPPDAIAAWQAGIDRNLYLRAMDRGEVFFIATASVDREPLVLGFSSDYPIENTTFGVSVYVRGLVVRRQIGTQLLQLAEAHARSRGATDVTIDASLAGVAFYKRHRYVEVAARQVTLDSGHVIACITMRKELTCST